MALGKRKIEWEEDVSEPIAMIHTPVPSPALMLQELLRQSGATLAQPRVDRELLRRLVMMSAAGAFSLWLALVVSANTAVSLVV